MARDDWLVAGRDRRTAATSRIYEAAFDLIRRDGYDDFTIDALAASIHCSPATIYRHTGGKAAILEAAVYFQAERILASVRTAIEGKTGSDRVVTATIVALQRIRSDPLSRSMRSMLEPSVGDWLIDSPTVTAFASEMLGLRELDPLAAQWLTRAFLALLEWPLKDPADEEHMVRRFLGPPLDDTASTAT